MKTILTFLLLLTFSFNAFPQVSSIIDKNNLSIITNTPLIFENGIDNLLFKGNYPFYFSFDSLQIDSSKIYNSSYLFNKNGRIILKIKYDGDPYSCNVYYYTKEGQLDKSYYLFNVDRIKELLDSLSSNIFYINTNFISLAKSCDVAELTKYQSNENGQISKSIVIKSNGNENVFDYQYDEKGRLIKILYNNELDKTFTYDQNENILTKEDSPKIISTAGNCKYIEAERFIYDNNVLVQIDKVCKTNKNINIKDSSGNINQSLPLTPELANSVMYANLNATSITIIDTPNPKWEILSSTVYENKLNEFKNWTIRKTYSIHDNSKKLQHVEFQLFDSKERLDKVKKDREQTLVIEKEEKERKINEALAQEELLRIEEQKTQEIKDHIERNHEEIMNQYLDVSSFSNNNNSSTIKKISDTMELNKIQRKKIIFDAYQTTYSDCINSSNKEKLNDMLLIQNNMSILFNAKTKRIEKEIINKQTISDKIAFLKEAINYIDK